MLLHFIYWFSHLKMLQHIPTEEQGKSTKKEGKKQT